MKDNKLNLFSNDKSVSKIIEQYKLNQKTYIKLIEAFQILGNFTEKANVEIYEINEENGNVKLYIEDNNDLIFIFCPIDKKKENTYKFEILNDDGIFEYDISLSKKYKLTQENIDLIRTKNVYNFKFGRLITNNKNFYNIFLGDDISYLIQIDFIDSVISAEDLLCELNKCSKKPNFLECLKIFENLLKFKNIEFNSANLSSFKNFQKNCSIKLENSNENSITKNSQKNIILGKGR